MTNADRIVRKELLGLLATGKAHLGFEEAISDFPLSEINYKLPDESYTPWHLVEHMRIAQWDILEYVRNPKHVSPDFPSGYWPGKDEIATPTVWMESVERFLADLDAVQEMVKNPKTDLFAPLPHSKNHTLFREALLVADHNAYHLGELVVFKRMLSPK
jgi:hypothetical protein